MAVSPSKGRVFSIEHPTEGMPALTVFSGNAGQLLRGDAPTIQVLKAIRQRAQRNGVPFIIHLKRSFRSVSSDEKKPMLLSPF